MQKQSAKINNVHSANSVKVKSSNLKSSVSLREFMKEMPPCTEEVMTPSKKLLEDVSAGPGRILQTLTSEVPFVGAQVRREGE